MFFPISKAKHLLWSSWCRCGYNCNMEISKHNEQWMWQLFSAKCNCWFYLTMKQQKIYFMQCLNTFYCDVSHKLFIIRNTLHLFSQLKVSRFWFKDGKHENVSFNLLFLVRIDYIYNHTTFFTELQTLAHKGIILPGRQRSPNTSRLLAFRPLWLSILSCKRIRAVANTA